MKIALPLLFCFSLLFVVGTPVSVFAAEPFRDPIPLWQLAITNVKKTKLFSASRVVTQITALDGKDVFLGSIKSVDIVAPGTEKPAWVNVSKKTTGSPGFTMELNLHIEDNPGDVLDGYDTWTAKGEAPINGELMALWEGAKSGKETNTALAYIDSRTAQTRRVDFVLPIHSNFGTRAVKVTVFFDRSPNGVWLPATATIDQAGQFMFWKRHLIITKSFHVWAGRPAA